MGPDKVLIKQRHVTHEAGEPSLDPGLGILLEEGGGELLLVNLEVEHVHHVVAAHHDVGHARLLHKAEAGPLLCLGSPGLVVRVDMEASASRHTLASTIWGDTHRSAKDSRVYSSFVASQVCLLHLHFLTSSIKFASILFPVFSTIDFLLCVNVSF